jgi:site-specific recombinase XerD
MAATETGHGRFVLNKYGRPYSYSGFDQAFDDWCEQAGLPTQCTAHGVRKAAAALMCENGASEAELCAIFGWKIGSRMAAYYAKKYNARRAQTRALRRLPHLGGETAKRTEG